MGMGARPLGPGSRRSPEPLPRRGLYRVSAPAGDDPSRAVRRAREPTTKAGLGFDCFRRRPSWGEGDGRLQTKQAEHVEDQFFIGKLSLFDGCGMRLK